MGKYYVAGIPFDSENSLKHYGVKGMEWNKHKFGLDADTRFIKWINPNDINVGSYSKYGKMAEAAAKQKYGAATPHAPRPVTTYNKQQVTDHAKRMQQNMAQKKWDNSPLGKASNFVTGTANRAGKAIGTAANAVGNWAGQQAQNVGNTVGQAAQDVSKWAGQQAQNVGNTIGGAAQNAGNAVGQAARDVANSAPVQAVGRFVDKNITGNTDRAAAQGYQQIAENLADNHHSQKWEDAAKRAQERADNTLFGRVGTAANAVGQAAQNVANSAPVQAVGEAARNAGNAVSGAVNAAGDWVGQQAQNVSNTVGQAAEQARGGIGGFFDRVGNAVGGAANAVGDWAGQAANNVGNAVSGAANKATEGAKGFLNSAGQWVSGAANNVKNTASKAASDAKKGASGFLNSAGQWVSNAAGNVKNAAQNVGNTVGQAAQNVGNAVGQAAQNVGEFVTGRNANENLERLYAENIANGGNGMSPELDEARAQYNRTLPGMAEWARDNLRENVGYEVEDAARNAGNWIGNQAKNVGQAVSGAAGNVADWARNVPGNIAGAAQGVGDWARNAAGNAGNFVDQNITGNSARAEANRYNNFAQNPNMDSVQQLMNQRAAENAQARADSTLFGRVGNAAGAVGDWARNVPGNIAGTARGVGDWAGQAAQNIGNAVSGAAGWVGDRAREVANGPVGQFAGNVAQGVGQFVNGIENARLQPKVQAATQQMVDNYTQYLQDHPENMQSPRHAEWLREQVKNDPQLRAYYEQYLNHSALNEKPDGVSDAFWEKFTADGGTREDYERDWR